MSKQAKHVWRMVARYSDGMRAWEATHDGREATIRETRDRCSLSGQRMFEMSYSPDGRTVRFGCVADARTAFSEGVDRIERGW